MTEDGGTNKQVFQSGMASSSDCAWSNGSSTLSHIFLWKWRNPPFHNKIISIDWVFCNCLGIIAFRIEMGFKIFCGFDVFGELLLCT